LKPASVNRTVITTINQGLLILCKKRGTKEEREREREREGERDRERGREREKERE
jgi:hypothetical protein